MALVSVSIPAYNQEDVIGETIESVLGQTYEDIEVIVVDDGSEDRTASVVDRYSDDPRLRYVYQENQGYPGARNTGLRLSEGEYVAFIAGDDLWVPEKLERQVALLESTDATLVHSNVYHIDDDGTVTGIRWSETPPSQADREEFIRRLFMRNFICIQSVVCDRSLMDKRRFEEDFQIVCDHDMWLRLAQDANIEYMDELLVKKRYHENNLSSDYERLYEERVRLVERTVERYDHLEPYKGEKLSSVHLTYGLNLLMDGRPTAGRRSLRRSLKEDVTNWKAAVAILVSYGGRKPIEALMTGL